ncbi:PREDICTED: uncharacterized protein LOC108370357 [Rhagoletis zephyria]|uniref:uncharacterized protein LOC108370357 n=2 Tax=Rhagoletis zephyria TaxID=28612 RepID=UPI0008119ABC|nr:PREDICTED: uncharacterized protein LOC108370357 [Rhagoletis zephyria]
MDRRHQYRYNRNSRREHLEEEVLINIEDNSRDLIKPLPMKKQRLSNQQDFEKQSNTSVRNPPQDERDLEYNICSVDSTQIQKDYTSLVMYPDEDCAMDNEQTLTNEILVKKRTQSLPKNEATNLENFTSDPLISVSRVKPFTNKSQGSEANIKWEEIFSQYILCELYRYEYNDAQRLKAQLTQVCLNFEPLEQDE